MDPLDRRDRLIENTLRDLYSEADKAARQNRFRRRRRKIPILRHVIGFVVDLYWWLSGFNTREYACCAVRLGYGLIMLFLLFSLALINLNTRRLEKELIEDGALPKKQVQTEAEE